MHCAAPTLPRTTSTSLSMVLPNVLEIIRFNNDILHRIPKSSRRLPLPQTNFDPCAPRSYTRPNANTLANGFFSPIMQSHACPAVMYSALAPTAANDQTSADALPNRLPQRSEHGRVGLIARVHGHDERPPGRQDVEGGRGEGFRVPGDPA
ncbi:hypothetical protein MHUMG1_02901 [Metarhizium humberi]|uniref:Uncharacterized protein n=1 Tax=Metarhizium humberi TaxID=2596975 RepID=A0A9P8S9Y8_9HYPO|nr:hypothetical protein MHUMG1_02901 [Metarhizium humberi]